jgi:hypothetical protein
VGTGGSQEAPFSLKAAVPAGTWHAVLDSIVIAPVDVHFELLWRRGATDTSLAVWDHHFDPKGGGDFTAIAYEIDEATDAIPYQAGDLLIFRYTGTNATSAMAYIPNGDGVRASGRIPNLTLP